MFYNANSRGFFYDSVFCTFRRIVLIAAFVRLKFVSQLNERQLQVDLDVKSKSINLNCYCKHIIGYSYCECIHPFRLK